MFVTWIISPADITLFVQMVMNEKRLKTLSSAKRPSTWHRHVRDDTVRKTRWLSNQRNTLVWPFLADYIDKIKAGRKKFQNKQDFFIKIHETWLKFKINHVFTNATLNSSSNACCRPQRQYWYWGKPPSVYDSCIRHDSRMFSQLLYGDHGMLQHTTQLILSQSLNPKQSGRMAKGTQIIATYSLPKLCDLYTDQIRIRFF